MSEALKILQEFRENKRYSYMYDRIYTAIEELLAQPEQEPEQSSKWWYGKGVEDTKYFLTRKPLSDEKVREYLIDQYSFVYRDAFTDGVLWAEAQHSITGVVDE